MELSGKDKAAMGRSMMYQAAEKRAKRLETVMGHLQAARMIRKQLAWGKQRLREVGGKRFEDQTKENKRYEMMLAVLGEPEIEA